MDRRRQSRVFVDLPVQIWGMDSQSRPYIQPASLRTISGRGATLQCVDARLKPGDVVDVLYEGTLSSALSGVANREPKWPARWESKTFLPKPHFGMSIHFAALPPRGKVSSLPE
jgi:hypothetical protein